MRVTLDVFSGRSNPAWDLSAAERGELAARLAGLPPADEPPAADGLGYRGFVISNPSGEGGLPTEIRVCGGRVSVRGAGGEYHALDAAGLEPWLTEQARREGHGDLVEPTGW